MVRIKQTCKENQTAKQKLFLEMQMYLVEIIWIFETLLVFVLICYIISGRDKSLIESYIILFRICGGIQ